MTVRNDSDTNGTLCNRLKQKQLTNVYAKKTKKQNKIEFCSIMQNLSHKFKRNREKFELGWIFSTFFLKKIPKKYR